MGTELAVSVAEENADPAPPLEVRYRSTVGGDLVASSVDDTKASFAELLAARRGQDRRRHTTSVGPHLDDLELLVDGNAARVHASQGQHRAIVLAIKLAEIRHLSAVMDEPPVLLLDDISSELDAARSAQLFDTVAELDAQVILTTTDLGQVPRTVLDRLGPARLYDVSAGTLALRLTSKSADC